MKIIHTSPHKDNNPALVNESVLNGTDLSGCRAIASIGQGTITFCHFGAKIYMKNTFFGDV
jgi:hypothetical protein